MWQGRQAVQRDREDVGQCSLCRGETVFWEQGQGVLGPVQGGFS